MSISSPPSPPIPLSPFPVRRFTVEEYHRMAETGVLAEEERVELLEGWIVPKMTRNPPHDTTVALADEAIRSRLPAGWQVRTQSAITTDDSEPEPDVIVVRGSIRDYVARHPVPADIGLLIEVAETSLDRDRNKRRLYAKAGVQVYWIINLVGRQIEVYTDPTGPEDEPQFRREEIFAVDQTIPLIIEKQQLAELSVAALLP